MAEDASHGGGFDPFGKISHAVGAGISTIAEQIAHPGGHAHAGHGHGHPGKFESLHGFNEWAAEYGVARPIAMGVFFVPLMFLSILMVPQLPTLIWGWIWITMPIWASIGLGIVWFHTWLWYIQGLFFATRKPVLLELKFPREITKSPRAMEVALSNVWNFSGEGIWFDTHWEGKVRPIFSLELASFGGEVHFYIWCWRNMKDIFESAIYAQYPEVEIYEVEDYARKFVYDPNESDLFGNDLKMDRADDPEGILPIKSYIDFELDKDPKEEHKVDPIASVIELLSSLRGSEQAWVQIICTAAKAGQHKEYMKKCDARIKDIRKQASLNPGKEDAPEDDENKYGFPRTTWVENHQIESIQRHMGKRVFRTGIRLCYLAKLQDYRPTVMFHIRWIFLPFNDWNKNYLRPTRWHGPFDWPWQDFKMIRWRLTIRRFLDAYRRRSYFYSPWRSPDYYMSVESLASLFHPPSATVESPGLARIPSAKAKPPSNLPM